MRTARARRGGALAILTLLAAIALAGPGGAQGASLIADYRFDDSLASSVPGAPPLDGIAPIGIYSTATVHGRPDRVLAWQQGGGLRFPRAALPNPATYSTILTFAMDDVSGYRRILSFDTYDNGGDHGVYNNGGKYGFYEDDAFPQDVVLADGQFADVAFTRDPQGLTSGYVAGKLHFNHPDPAHEAIVQADGLRYFKDNAANNNENASGRVARIRIYDGALTPTEVATIQRTGGLAATAAWSEKPRLVKRKRKPRAVATGITVSCPAEAVPCALAGVLKAQSKGAERRIGSLTGSLGAGMSQAPSIRLSKTGRKLIAKRGRLPVSASVTVTPGSGVAATATASRKL